MNNRQRLLTAVYWVLRFLAGVGLVIVGRLVGL